jgi:type I restriction enzyme M protein
MTLENLRQLEASLWEAADHLRANSKLNASEYSMPVLGLIFLRHATNRFDAVRAKIEARLPRRGGRTRPIVPQDFEKEAAIFLPEEARYDTLVHLKEEEDLGGAINRAMRRIEEQVPSQLEGVLPKDYTKFDKALLADLVRIFNREELRTATSDDLFGRIYEYFLNKFAMSGAQEGGEYFTPPSIVRTIVNFIEPTRGTVLDPACGSGGMFVQAAHAIAETGQRVAAAVTFHGREKSETNTHLARMNLAVHGLEGDIRQGNTFYDRWEEFLDRCDFVMANPPFNVDMVDPKNIKGDPRLFTQKKIPGISAKTKTVSNANYLWIQYFYAYLNERGRAGFVMAQSATDAGHGEKEIRQEILATGDVDILVSIGTNFFYTRSLPCSLWFFDRGRPSARRDRVLMLDARHIYRVISRKIRDFSDEQLANLTAIVHLYRGETDRYLTLIGRYFEAVFAGVDGLAEPVEDLDAPLREMTRRLHASRDALSKEDEGRQVFVSLLAEQAESIAAFEKDRAALLKALQRWAQANRRGATRLQNAAQFALHDSFEPLAQQLSALRKQIQEVQKLTLRAVDHARKELTGKAAQGWGSREVRGHLDALDQARHEALEAVRAVTYPFAQVTWLQSRFPDARMTEVPGLCKVVTQEEIAEQDHSLTPGRYVGVAPPEPEDEEHVEARLREIHAELEGLNEEAVELAAKISANFGELVG